ncbi:hypothetical protein BT67DRAFT_24447 [Trichocladium antarcticum]|uniref:FmHP n=1 Tax=Trichocladium antarcticum TaxID=1450529 RepID=A0AAN6ZI79_9PEZI|nr:hypothetical protein BT67DRAFT_24447 [Trichocladium antarcticum]
MHHAHHAMASPPDAAPTSGGPNIGAAKPGRGTPPPPTTAPAPPAVTDADGVNPLDFQGAVDTNHSLPSAETIRRIDKYVVLDKDGKSHTFRSLYAAPHTARRVLIVFIRHFLCGNCQQYLTTLSRSMTPDALLRLPLTTFVAVIGCGDPSLIDWYATATACPFPIYADPTRKLYAELGMVRTLALGPPPAYMGRGLVASTLRSIGQGLMKVPSGLALKAGDGKQVGGEFLFEPVAGGDADGVEAGYCVPASPPLATPEWVGGGGGGGVGVGVGGEGKKVSSETSLDGKGDAGGEGEDKAVTWCHRMRTTRDHVEIPELMEVLGLDGHGEPPAPEDKAAMERWARAKTERKGFGKTLAGPMNALKLADAGGK